VWLSLLVGLLEEIVLPGRATAAAKLPGGRAGLKLCSEKEGKREDEGEAEIPANYAHPPFKPPSLPLSTLLSPFPLPGTHLITIVCVVHNFRQNLAELDVNEKRGQLQDVGERGLKVCLVEPPGRKLLEQTRVGFVR
jgi:hypothetical protein